MSRSRKQAAASGPSLLEIESEPSQSLAPDDPDLQQSPEREYGVQHERKYGTGSMPDSADPSQLLALAVQRDFDIDKLRELMALEREWRRDKAESEYAIAMSRFGELKQIVTHNRQGTTAGNARFSYADFPQMVDTITPWLTQCGLTFSHRQDPPVMAESGKVAYVMVHCTIQHTAGHAKDFSYPAIPDMRLDGKVSPSQLIQLAVTYTKRQTLAMALGLATAEDRDDDDSSGAMAEKITIAQAVHIKEALAETEGDEGKFRAYMKVEKIEDIPLQEYGKAIKALEVKANAKLSR